MTPKAQLTEWKERTKKLSQSIGKRKTMEEAEDWLDLVVEVTFHGLTYIAVVTDTRRSVFAGSIGAKKFDAAVGKMVLEKLSMDLQQRINEVIDGKRTSNLVFPPNFYQRAAFFLNQLFLEIDDMLDKAPRLFSDEVFEILFDAP